MLYNMFNRFFVENEHPEENKQLPIRAGQEDSLECIINYEVETKIGEQ